jgi:hypothetical protein
MAGRPPDSLERLTQTELIGVVRELIGEVGRLRAENEKLSGAFTELKAEHQAVKDELARLKNLPPQTPQWHRQSQAESSRFRAAIPSGFVAVSSDFSRA